MFSSLGEVDLNIVDLDRIDMFPVVNCSLEFLLVVNLELGLVRAEPHLVFSAEYGGEMEKEGKVVDVIGN